MKSFFNKVEAENIGYQIKYDLISDEEIRKNINFYHWSVRELIAKKRKCLDILIHDVNLCVKCEIIKQDYCLDILVKDKDWYVRTLIARQGNYLDILKNDEDVRVKGEAERQLKIRGLL